MARLAEPDDMALRYDTRVLGQLLSDQDGQRLNPEEFAGSPIMLTALEDATGEILSALQVADRYTTEDLTALLADESLSFVKQLCCRIAWLNLLTRKPATEQWARQIKPARESVDAMLESLRTGKTILDLQAAKEAGQATADTLTRADLARWNLYSNRPEGKFWPRRRTFNDR